MCDLRLALESHAAGLAAVNHSENDLREIHYALEAMRRLTAGIIAAPQEQPLLGELAQEDVRFHIAIMMAAKNELIKKEILRLHLINRLMTTPASIPTQVVPKTESDARRRAVLAMHDNIYNAIARSELIERTLFLLSRAESGVIARELTAEELAYNS
jgi:DNA-binding FadR family transcriptional regulator